VKTIDKSKVTNFVFLIAFYLWAKDLFVHFWALLLLANWFEQVEMEVFLKVFFYVEYRNFYVPTHTFIWQ